MRLKRENLVINVRYTRENVRDSLGNQRLTGLHTHSHKFSNQDMRERAKFEWTVITFKHGVTMRKCVTHNIIFVDPSPYWRSACSTTMPHVGQSSCCIHSTRWHKPPTDFVFSRFAPPLSYPIINFNNDVNNRILYSAHVVRLLSS